MSIMLGQTILADEIWGIQIPNIYLGLGLGLGLRSGFEFEFGAQKIFLKKGTCFCIDISTC